MNLWARMLAELPATGQRVIARAQRISLPRQCDAATRQLRLRQALCHAATVRAVYGLLDPPAQAALQHLRGERGGISPDDLERHYGAVRPWRDLAADPRPRTISEQLLLLGWLLPRPTAPRHPLHFLVPPEVRRWLPVPLPAPLTPPSPPAQPSAHLPALRAAATLLLACADQPLPITQTHTLRRTALRQITPRLTPLDAGDGAALLDWLLPLLVARDLISCHQGRASLTPAGQRFLTLPPALQQTTLRDAWIRSPDADPWLWRLRVDPRGIDWPLLRRRLCTWAAAIPADDQRDPATRYAELARSFGPLADAHTHGFRSVDRAPWQPKRAAAVLDAALRGPLAWLGLIGTAAAPAAPIPGIPTPALPLDQPLPPGETLGSHATPGGNHPVEAQDDHPICATRCATRRNPDARRGARAAGAGVAPAAGAGRTIIHRRLMRCRRRRLRAPPPCARAEGCDQPLDHPWRYCAPGVIRVPHAAPHAATLRLLPFVQWDSADADATEYRITTASLARARRQGCSAARCRQLLDQQAGPPPDGWCDALEDPPPAMRLVPGAVLLVDVPAELQRATRARSVRRYLTQRIAPGIALVRPHDRAALVRALSRQGIPCTVEDGDAPQPPDSAHTTAPAPRVQRHPAASLPRAGATPPPADLSAGERAALLIACAHYRLHAPPDAPLLPHTGLEARLRAGLSPHLQTAVESALADLRPPPAPTDGAHASPAPLGDTLHTLRAALARTQPVELTYDTAGQGALTTRTVRPLALEQRADTWYLRAYCSARQAERTFRVDRIMAIVGCP